MTFDYARSQSTATRLIQKFGQSGFIRRVTVTGGSPFDPGSGTETIVNHACTLVVLDYRNSEIDGTRVLASDKKLIVATAGLAIEPTTSDAAVVGGVVHQIVDVKPLSPAGVVVMWEIQARR